MADTGFAIPDLATLKSRAQAAINAFLPGADARLRRNVLDVLATVLAGQTHGLYGYMNFIATTALPDRATGEYLEAWCTIWGVPRKPAATAAGNVTFTGTNGTDILAGTQVKRQDGVTYAVVTSGTIAGGTAVLPVEALDAGDAGNAVATVALSLVNPITGVQSAAVVAAGGLTGGADTEDDEALRERLLDRIQQPPHGGATSDYERWALEVQGVTAAWPSPQELGPGTVTVRFTVAADDTHPDGIPLPADVSKVQDYIDGLRPTTAEVFVVAPTAVALDITIADLTPNTPEVKAAVEAELSDMIARDRVPEGTIYLSRIWEAVAIAAGERSHRITSPVTDVAFGTNEIAKLGTVTYT